MLSPEFLSGVIGGGVAVGVVHPLDTIRTRIQRSAVLRSASTARNGILQPNFPKAALSYLTAIKEVYTNYGTAGFFRGVMPPTLVRGLEVGVNRYCYTQAERFTTRYQHISFVKKKKVQLQGMWAGFGCSFVAQPILLVKNRAQTLTGVGYKETFRSYYDMVLQIHKTSGWRGFLTGLTPNTIFYTLTFGQFYWAYDKVESWGWGPAWSGFGAGLASWPIFYPVEVVRTIAHTTNMTAGQATRQIIAQVRRQPSKIGGIMWPALGMTMMRAVPRWGLTFQVHGWCMHYFRSETPSDG